MGATKGAELEGSGEVGTLAIGLEDHSNHPRCKRLIGGKPATIAELEVILVGSALSLVDPSLVHHMC